MEPQDSTVTPPISQTPPAGLPVNGFIDKIKNLSKKQKIIAGIVTFLVIAGIVASFFMRSSPDPEVIATVGSTKLPKSYLAIELSYYPATPTAEINKAFVEKIIDDQITLEEGKKDGYIADYPSGDNLSKEEYLKRTELVGQVKNKINDSGYVIKGKLVSVWFYNNQYIGPKGLEESKKIAFQKIQPLYEQVKNGSITIDQAGEAIANDESLIEIDPAYKGNAIDEFTFYDGDKGTFWSEFNDLIWAAEQGEVTPLYLGGGILRDGKPMEELYIFAKVEYKSTNENFTSYTDWLEKKKKELNISISDSLSFSNFSLIEEAFADDNPDNTFRSGSWMGKVKTPTGMGISGATAIIVTGCNAPNGKQMTTDGNGSFDSGTDGNLSCTCAPHTITARYQDWNCDSFRYDAVGNPIAEIRQDITCSPPPPPPTPTPSPTPTPPPACNVSCTTHDYCQAANDGCTSCITGTCQKCEPKPAETRTLTCPPGHEGSITETRTYACPNGTWSEWTATSNTCTPPPACGDSCASDSYCFGAPDGCTSCIGGVCKKPPACNDSCTNASDCAKSVDGCTACIPSNSGTGNVCAKPPACNSACVRDDQCGGDATRDGCTVCAGGTCKAPACGIACTKDTQCAGAKDGCIVCMGGVCKTPPACGTACTTKADCANPKDGCSECLEGTCTDYSDNMCKCDGIVAEMNYPNPFKFEAFGKVEGSDIKKAEIADITFRLTKDNQVIAKSDPIRPQVVENSAAKMRFKAAWQTAPPQMDKNATYRVFADVRCKPKKIVASAGELANASMIPVSDKTVVVEPVKQLPVPKGTQLLADLINQISKLMGRGNDLITKEALAQFVATSPVPTQAQSNLQLQTLNFIKIMDTDNCKFVMWKFDETLF